MGGREGRPSGRGGGTLVRGRAASRRVKALLIGENKRSGMIIKKLLKKESNANSKKIEYTEDYPEHLKHLYLAEEEMLKKQQKPRNTSQGIQEGKESITPKSNRVGRQLKIKTANQKAKEDYERIKAEQDRQKEAARQRKDEREKAQKLYKQKKMEAYKILSKRTKKGQPNLNIQMEYLLQKIQQNT